jgi:hypothetical protein
MSSIPRKCPSCSSPLVVTQLGCTHCDTAVVGRFELNPFLRLSPDSLHFLEDFIRNRGNVKEMERSSGESYWAIRKQLDEVIEELGFDIQPAEDVIAQRRQEVLSQLSQGEIDVQEAAHLLSQLGKAGP